MPKVSVILTSFNHEAFLQEAIDSVLNQSFTDFELIIWDDASSDNSWDLINQYSDPRIKAFRNDVQKRGIWGINKAVSEVATGEYIAIHHSDDVWELNKLEMQVAFLNAHTDIGAVFTNALAINENSLPLTDEHHFYADVFNKTNRTRYEWLHFFFSEGNALCHPSVLIRKQCYKDCGSYRYGLAQLGDFDMWMRLCLKYEIHILPEPLVRFRVRDNEINTSGNRAETRIRWKYEFYELLSNYQNIKNFDDLVKVFPGAEKYQRDQESDMDFVLAMSILEENTELIASKLFGLNLLFRIISDSERAENIKQLYGFDYKDFISLTAKYDVFSTEEVFLLHQEIAACGDQLEAQHQELNTYAEQTQNLSDQIEAQQREIVEQAHAFRDHIEAQQQELNAYEEQTQNLRNQIEAQQREIVEQAHAFSDHIEAQQQELKVYEEQSQNLRKQIEAQQREIVEQAHAFSDHIEAQRQELKAYEEQTRVFSNQLEAQRAECESLVANRDQSITELQAQIESLRIGTTLLESQCAVWENIIAERDEQRIELDITINKIYASRSWRLTRHLRFFARLIREPKSVFARFYK